MRGPVWLCLWLCAAMTWGGPNRALAALPVEFGDHVRDLQKLVDHRYGKGRIDVSTDFIGAQPGDADPVYWVTSRAGSLRIELLRVGHDRDALGWYVENGAQPKDGGVLFREHSHQGDRATLTFGERHLAFGFYVEPGRGHTTGKSERFFTNRLLNDAGAAGTGAIHPPLDGDVQALVFDVSRCVGTEAYLVCFEDRDTGGRPKHRYRDSADDGDDDGDNGDLSDADPDGHVPWVSDNDFLDVVFEVRPDGATPARPISFGALKRLYR
ncbi:MAG TPA: hypothetical protein VGK89_00840 [Candidatus Eisenbacteria bacterium]